MGRFGAAIDRLLARWLRAAAPDGVARPVLDLHGYGVKDALALTERFLADAQREGLPEVEIVYGKGRGSRADTACCARSSRAGSRPKAGRTSPRPFPTPIAGARTAPCESASAACRPASEEGEVPLS